jgi:predicted enzyme related to lactoylglutathione lyase
MKVNRLLINICSEHLPESKLFYTTLFDFRVDYDSDWFVHLIASDKKLELGIIDKNNELVPEAWRGPSAGSYITLVVPNVDELYGLAQASGFVVIQAPEDTFYGQRRMLLQDPSGYLVDVSSMI